MSIVTDEKGNSFSNYQQLSEQDLNQLELDAPLTHALIVVKCQEKYLLMFNKWRKSWELPGGVIEQGESPRECAVRELYEETNQLVEHIEFKGLMKFDLSRKLTIRLYRNFKSLPNKTITINCFCNRLQIVV